MRFLLLHTYNFHWHTRHTEMRRKNQSEFCYTNEIGAKDFVHSNSCTLHTYAPFIHWLYVMKRSLISAHLGIFHALEAKYKRICLDLHLVSCVGDVNGMTTVIILMFNNFDRFAVQIIAQYFAHDFSGFTGWVVCWRIVEKHRNMCLQLGCHVNYIKLGGNLLE